MCSFYVYTSQYRKEIITVKVHNREFKIRRLRLRTTAGRALSFVCSTGLSRANIER